MRFYRETNLEFKKELGCEIPKDWEVVKIRDVYNVETGTTPSTKIKDYWENGTIKWLTPMDLSKLNGKIHISDSERKITEKALKDYNLTLMPKGSIILSTRAPVGYVAVIDDEMTFNQGCKGLIPKNRELICTEYYAYYLLSIKRELERLSGGSTFKELSKQALENLKILLPPLEEQKAIAQILSTVDEAIQKVNETIKKAERLKKGLMQELLTGRVRVRVEDGQMRFYKENNLRFIKELGAEIPKDWDVVRLGDVVTKIIDSPHKIPKKVKLGIPFVSVNYMLKFSDYNFFIDETVEGLEYISKNDFEEFSKRFDPEKGDILYSKWGTPGVAKLINTSTKFIGSCSVALIKTKKDRINSLYLVYSLNSQTVRLQILPYSKTSTRTEIHIGHIKKIIIPLPPLPEQQKIAEILSTVDKLIEVRKKQKDKLERVKKGLMNLLLTGKVRVVVNGERPR